MWYASLLDDVLSFYESQVELEMCVFIAVFFGADFLLLYASGGIR